MYLITSLFILGPQDLHLIQKLRNKVKLSTKAKGFVPMHGCCSEVRLYLKSQLNTTESQLRSLRSLAELKSGWNQRVKEGVSFQKKGEITK